MKMWTSTVTVVQLTTVFVAVCSLSLPKADIDGDLINPLERVSCKVDNGNCSPHAKCVPTSLGRVCLCKRGFAGDGLTCTADTGVRTADICPKRKADFVQHRHIHVTENMSGARKASLFRKIIAEMSKQNETVAAQLASAYVATTSGSKSDVAAKFFEDSRLLVVPGDAGRLRFQLQSEANERPDWARAFVCNAALVTECVATVFSEEFPRLGENAWWSSCFSVLGKTVERIAKTLTVTATCDVDTASGLPEFPVQGRIKFTQPLMGGPTTIDIRLRGFSDSNKHGLNVREFGSTENQCQASGPLFNPHDKMLGGPDDEERQVGDLGNVQPDANGRVIEKRQDRLISLFGENNIVGRVADVQRDEDDLGRGDNELKSGNVGPSIACCLIEPFKGGR